MSFAAVTVFEPLASCLGARLRVAVHQNITVPRAYHVHYIA